MARGRTGTSDWFERVCVRCGATYRHADLWTTAGGVGGLQLQAVVAVATELTNSFINEPPCPVCGCVRPATVAKWKQTRHLVLALGMILPVLLVCLFGWSARVNASWVLAGGAAVGWGLHALTVVADLNRRAESNRRRAEALIARNQLVVVAGVNPALARGEPPVRTRRAGLWLAVGAVGVLLSLAPAVCRVSGGWTENPDTKQLVVTPGNTVRVRFPQAVSAIAELWAGTPQAVMILPDTGDQLALPAQARTRTWNRTIREEAQSSYPDATLWADVTLPDDPTLVGRTVWVRVDMAVEYPKRTPDGFEDTATDVSHTWEIAPVSKGQLALYQWSFGLLLAGGGLTLLYGFGLMESSKRLAALPYRHRWSAA